MRATEPTKEQLLHAFGRREPIVLAGMQFMTLEKIEHEDGSGQSFNVTGYTAGRLVTVYLRTYRGNKCETLTRIIPT